MQDRCFIPLWRARSFSLPSRKIKVEHLHETQSSWVWGSANDRAHPERAAIMVKIARVHFAKTSDNNTLQTVFLCVFTLGIPIHPIHYLLSFALAAAKCTSYLAVHFPSFSFNLLYSIYLEKFCSSPHRIKKLEWKQIKCRAQNLFSWAYP